MKQKLLLSMILLLISYTISGCSMKTESSSEEDPIQIALTQDMLSFDPMMTTDIFSEAVLRCIYTSLYDFDDDLNLRPKLVKKETIIDDHTWELEIHDNVTFHDGTKLTTDDIIFSIERARLGGRTEKLLEIVDYLEKIDDTHFRIRSKEPYADFLTIFAKAETSIVSKAVVTAPEYDFKKPVGAGPFQLIQREENHKISLKRYDDCYLGKAASPYLDFVVLVTEQERTTAFLKGEVDILFSVSAYDCEKLRLSPNVRLLQKPSTKIEYLSLNTNHPPLDKEKVRLAISYGINRENITNGVYHGYADPSSSLIPEGIIGYVDSPITYDPAYAKKLLADAGYENGFELNVITIDTIRKNTLEYIKLDLAQIGIELNYNLITMKEAVDLMTAGNHEALLNGWAFSADPNGVLPLLLGSGSGKTMNSSNYNNPKFDQLLVKARGEKDRQTKTKIYEEINNLIITEAPIIILQNPNVLSAVLNNIDGIHFNAQGLIQYESIYRKSSPTT